jgi:hypothetical protein
MNTIDIGTVLQRFDDTYDERSAAVKEYGIRFLTADGRYREMRCRKGVKAPKQQLHHGNQPKGKFRYNLQRNATMLVHDLVLNETRAVKPAMIFAFQDFESTEFIKVFH